MQLLMDTDEEFIPTRQSLLERLRRWDDQEGWQQFFDTYWKLIYRTARKAGLNPTEAEEVVQETVIGVAQRMPDFQYRAKGGSFKAWLLGQTKWRIADQLRKRRREGFVVGVENLEVAQAMGEIPNPVANKLDELWDTEWELNLLDAALARVKARIEPRHYQIFHLAAVKHWSALRVARSLKISLAQVYTVKHRVAKDVRATLTRIQKHAS